MKAIERLLEVMDRLRDPDSGCPWDREQDFTTIAPYTLEEAYEVADAIVEGDLDALEDELGDLLFQVVFHARLAREAGAFDFEAVAAHAADKMIRRHPHVFADARIEGIEAQTASWESAKAAERAQRAARRARPSSRLDGIPAALPALARALKLQKRAGRAGLDWPGAGPVFDKIEEELAELHAALDHPDGRPCDARVADELGDLLFSVVNLARHLAIDAETALRGANAKFERRFRAVEGAFSAAGKSLEAASPDELDAAWREAKARLASES